MRLIDADALSELLVKTYEKAPTEKALLFVALLLKNNEQVPTVKLRLMKTEECAGHTIDYAMGWKACVEWIKNGGDKNVDT